MFYSNTLNLIQVGGGTQVKQGDLGSRFSYKLANEKDQELDNFDKEVAHINLVLDDKIVFTTTATVDNSTVTFNIDKAIPTGLYYLEIKIRDYIFPSDKQTIIFVQSGAVAYDLKELVPNYDTNMTLQGILSDLSQKGIDISDLNRRMAEKVNKDEVTNVMTPKGTLAYASLPTSGNQVGWYYYCPDGDGVHPAGNYVWNGTTWYFGGTGDEGYNLLKEDNVELKNSLNDMFVANNIFDVDNVENGYYSNTNNLVSNFFHFKFKALKGDIISFTRYKIFDGQWGIVLNSDKLYGSIASLSPDTSNDEYVSFVMPINGEVIVNMRSYIATMISVNADYPNEYTPCKIQANKNIKYTYDNAEYISKYNLFDSSKLQDGFVLANGDIDTAYNDNFKHIDIAVKAGDVVRFTKQEVFSTQAGGIYNKDGFMANLSTYMKDKITHYEYVCADNVYMLKINVRIDQPAIAKIITKNNDFTELFGKSYVSNITPDSESINILKNIFMTTFDYSALFSNGVSIGDSLTAGDYGNGEGVHAYNYPKAFSKITGIAMTNKGHSGTNPISWWNEENPNPSQYSDFDLAFILHGQNGGLRGNLDASDDSNAGYYCKIIELLKTANPNMAIFLLTIPVNGAYRVNEPTNEIIKTIGKKYDIPVLDIYNDSKILNHANMPIYQPYDGVLHYGKVGALALATEVKRLMNDSISRDLSRYNVIDS